jgi:hypothetical protein
MGSVRGLRKTSSNMECQFWRNRAPKADVVDSAVVLLLLMLEPRFEVMVVLLCRMELLVVAALLVPDVLLLLLLLLDMLTPLRRKITCSVVFRTLVLQI